MKKLLASLFIFTAQLFYQPGLVEAGLIKVQKNGTIEMKVLSATDELALSVPAAESLEVKELANSEVSGYSTIKIAKADGKVNVEVSNGIETKNLDASAIGGEIVEIEERPEVKKIKIGLTNDRFSLSQNGIVALTSYPLKVDSKSAQISVATVTGEKYLSVFPQEAVDTLLKTHLITRIPNKQIEILDSEDKLQYKIAGEKVFTILNFYEYKIPVTTNVSAATGEILYIEAPGWLKVINMLFG